MYGVPIMAQRQQTLLGTMRLQVLSLASLSGLRIRCCRELWCRLQTQLGSGVVVALAQASSYSSYWTPSLGTSKCCGWGPKKNKQTNKQKKFWNAGKCCSFTELSYLQKKSLKKEQLIKHFLKMSLYRESLCSLIKLVYSAEIYIFYR